MDQFEEIALKSEGKRRLFSKRIWQNQLLWKNSYA
jgi:hypothetical protein